MRRCWNMVFTIAIDSSPINGEGIGWFVLLLPRTPHPYGFRTNPTMTGEWLMVVLESPQTRQFLSINLYIPKMQAKTFRQFIINIVPAHEFGVSLLLHHTQLIENKLPYHRGKNEHRSSNRQHRRHAKFFGRRAKHTYSPITSHIRRKRVP